MLGGTNFVYKVVFLIMIILAGVFTKRRGSRLLGHGGTVIVGPDIAIHDAPDSDKADLFVLRRKRGMSMGSGSVGS